MRAYGSDELGGDCLLNLIRPFMGSLLLLTMN